MDPYTISYPLQFARSVSNHFCAVLLPMILLALSTVFTTTLKAQVLDPTFVTGTGFDNQVSGFLQIPTGTNQLIVVGNFSNYNGTAVNRVARLNLDGTIDATFTPPSNAVINGQINAVVRRPSDGKYIIAGQFNGAASANYVARLNTDGTLDNTFATTAINGNVNAIALDAGENIIAVGAFTAPSNRITRLLPNGGTDGTFNPGTGFVGGAGANAVAIDGGGNILVGGTFVSYNGTPSSRIARILPSGAIDGAFSIGAGFNAVVNAITMNGANILVGGDFTSYNGAARNRIIRLTNTGAIDATFTSGTGFDGIVNSIALAGGNILVGGGFTQYNAVGRNNIARLLTGGGLDVTFNPGNGFDNPVQSVGVQMDGQVVVGGQFGTYNASAVRNRIARFGFAAAAYVASAIFPEAAANDGSVAATRTVTLGPVGGSPDIEEWANAIVNGTNLTMGVHYTVANVPPGLTLVVTKTSNKVLTLSLTGNALAHANANDVNNMQITFLNASLEGNNAIGVQNLNGNLYTVDFMDPSGAAYSSTTFNEGPLNDGSITTTRTITLSGGETWNAGIANGANLTPGVGNDYTVANVPAGLTAVLTKNSATQITISFTGNAAAHAAINSVANVQFTFLNASVTSNNAAGVVGLNGQNLSINFNNPPNAAFSATTFSEAAVNNGSVTQTQTITLANDTWTAGVAIGANLVAGTHFNVANVPSGLTMVLTKTSTTVVTISFTGNAAAHAAANSVGNVQITFLNAAITSNNVAGVVGPLNGVNLTVNFLDPYAVGVYSGTVFTEVIPINNGSIANTQTITVSNDTWNSAIPNGTNLVAGMHFTVANVPTGLTATLTKNSATQLTISFTGNAAAHAAANSVGNVQFTFLSAALQSGNIATSSGLNGQNLTITFFNPLEAVYSSNVFNVYPTANNTFASSVLVNLIGTAWTQVGTSVLPGVFFNVTGLPAGTSLTSNFQSPTVAELTLSGPFSPSLNNASFTVTWFDPSVANSNVPLVLNLSPKTFSIGLAAPTPSTPSGPSAPSISAAPIITRLSSIYGQEGDPITIYGLNFTGVTEVTLGGTRVRSFTIISSTEIRAVVGPGATGTVQVTNGFGSGTYERFNFGPPPPPTPQIFLVSPQQVSFGETVTITGQSLTGATKITIGGVPVQSFNVLNDGVITFVNNSTISGDIEITTPLGSVKYTGGGLYYKKMDPPEIISLDPGTMQSGEDEIPLRLLGKNFTNGGAVTISTITGSVNARILEVSPDRTQAIVSVPGSARIPGQAAVRFYTPDSQQSNPATLTITRGQTPSIGSITFLPAASSTTATGQPFSLAIDGQNFFKTARVTLSGASANGTTFTDIPLNVTILGSNKAVLEIPGVVNNDGGTFTIRLQNFDGSFTEKTFRIARRPAPMIGEVSTSTRTNASGDPETIIIIRGQNFFNPGIGLSGSVLNITSWSPDQIVAVVPQNVAREINSSSLPPVLIVVNGDGQSDGSRPTLRLPVAGEMPPPPKDVPTPKITQLTILPAAVTTAATCKAFTVRLTGENFLNNALITLTGTDAGGRSWLDLQLNARILSPTEALVEVPSDVNCDPGTHTIRLINGPNATAQSTLNISCRVEPTIATASSTTQQTPNSSVPDQLLVIRGQGFNTPTVEFLNTNPPIVSWTPEEIVARVPPAVARKANAACTNPLIIVRNADGTIDAARRSVRFSLSQIELTAVAFQNNITTQSGLQSTASSSGDILPPVAFSKAHTQNGAEGGDVAVYPNPVSDILTVQIPREFVGSVGSLHISIVDAMGAEKLRINEVKTSKSVRISVSALSSGSYSLVLSDGTITQRKALVISR